MATKIIEPAIPANSQGLITASTTILSSSRSFLDFKSHSNGVNYKISPLYQSAWAASEICA